MKYFSIIALIILFSCSGSENFYDYKLKQIESKIIQNKDEIFSLLEQSAKNISKDGFTDAFIRMELDRLVGQKHYFIVGSFVNKDGFLQVTVPKQFAKNEGTDLNNQPHVNYVRRKKTKFISQKFRAVQGFEAFSYILPIVRDNAFNGSLNILLNPDKYLEYIVGDEIDKSNYDFLIFQANGDVLYSTISEFRNINLLNPEIFKNNKLFQSLNDVIKSTTNGTKISNIENNRRHKFFWRNIDFENNQWKLLIIKSIYA